VVDSAAVTSRIDRRAFLTAGGAALLLAGCSGDDTTATSSTGASPGSAPNTAGAETTAATTAGTAAATRTPDTSSATTAGLAALTAADFESIGTCQLLSEQTAGPFPLDEQFERRDITEGYAGHSMRLGLRVVDSSCAPIAGAAVEIWHCDATGDYSAFADGGGGKDDAEGTTFLRGTQLADADGIVEFHTLYPGWYSGRAVHIHLRVHVDDATVLTSQLYFDPDYTATVYAAEPYAEFGLPDTSNEDDGIAGDPAAEGTLLATSPGDTSAGSGTLGLLNLGVSPA
jgi:protocatechuate 3,4-dioxygenase beta subunit